MFKRTTIKPIDIKEVMRILNCSRATVYNYINKGFITGHRTNLGKPIYDRNEIEKLKEVFK